jgi:hypothetical protein
VPVITVFAPALEGDAMVAALAAVNRAAAEALGLAPTDVHSLLVPAACAVTGEQQVAPWPTAVLHGRRRPADAMARAASSVAQVLGERWASPVDEVWVQWAPEPG